MKSHIVLFIFLFFLPSSAFCQFYDCQGYWAKRPCRRGLVQEPFAEISPRRISQMEKGEIVRQLHDDARWLRSYGASVVVSDSVEFCTQQQVSRYECADRYEAFRKENFTSFRRTVKELEREAVFRRIFHIEKLIAASERVVME